MTSGTMKSGVSRERDPAGWSGIGAWRMVTRDA
jgi:hypothetical protein